MSIFAAVNLEKKSLCLLKEVGFMDLYNIGALITTNG